MHCLVANKSAACLVVQAGAPLLEQLQDLRWKRGQRQTLLSLQAGQGGSALERLRMPVQLASAACADFTWPSQFLCLCRSNRASI